jgi:hypothetical protein
MAGIFRHPRWPDVLDTGGAGGQPPGQWVCSAIRAGNLLVAPNTKTRRAFASKGRRIEKPVLGRGGGRLIVGQPPGLTARRASALILRRGALDKGENQASDGWREGRGTLQEKFHWRPAAPTLVELEASA